MSDLISRQAAMIVIENSGLDDDSKDTVVRVLEQLPSAQPEIIRCKDCKHYYYADNRIYYADNRIPQEQGYSCDLDGDRWKPEDFCSYAERRTDE